jgi:hypothetical protein
LTTPFPSSILYQHLWISLLYLMILMITYPLLTMVLQRHSDLLHLFQSEVDPSCLQREADLDHSHFQRKVDRFRLQREAFFTKGRRTFLL